MNKTDGLPRHSDRNAIRRSLESWLSSIKVAEDSWHANNLHVDEVESLEELQRQEWLRCSFILFDMLIHMGSDIDLIPFLFVDIESTSMREMPGELSLDWLMSNMDETTPPCFNYTSLDYYQNYYCSNLVSCSIDSTIATVAGNDGHLHFMSHIQYELTEMQYTRSVYVFYLR